MYFAKKKKLSLKEHLLEKMKIPGFIRNFMKQVIIYDKILNK